MRLLKEPAELDIMRRGGDQPRGPRGGAAISYAGTWEYELEAAIEYTFRRRGARGPAYTSIVGGGSNATVLHYVKQRPEAPATASWC